jgi:hypothetical protein
MILVEIIGGKYIYINKHRGRGRGRGRKNFKDLNKKYN